MLKTAAASQRLTGYNKILGAVLLTLATLSVIVTMGLTTYVVTVLMFQGDDSTPDVKSLTCTTSDDYQWQVATVEECTASGGWIVAG